MPNKIVLIGGAPCSGKTSLSQEIFKKLGFHIISTDSIRVIMQSVGDKNKFPKLFNADNMTAEEYLAPRTAEQIMEDEIEESKIVKLGIKNFIQDNDHWENYILEGVGLLPETLIELKSENLGDEIFICVNTNKEIISDIVHTRGLFGGANTYPDNLKEKEVEWAYQMNIWFKKEAERLRIETMDIETRNIDSLVERFAKLLS